MTFGRAYPTRNIFIRLSKRVLKLVDNTVSLLEDSVSGALRHYEEQDPPMSLAYRLTKIITGSTHRFPLKNGSEQLDRVLCQLTKEHPNLIVVINFDKTNMIMRSQGGCDYLNKVLRIVHHFNAQRKGYIFCIMSGTNVRPLHDLLMTSSGGYTPKEIPLPLLHSSHVLEVIKDLLGCCIPDKNIEISQECTAELDFVAQVLGGVPRYIELLVYGLGEQRAEGNFAMEVFATKLSSTSGSIHPHELLQRITELINERYSWTFTKLVKTLPCKVLVAYSIFEWPIYRNDVVGDETVGDLETEGAVFVQDNTKLVFPLVLLLNLAEAGHGPHLPMLLEKFNVMLSCDENERNSLGIFAIKCAALIENNKPITLSKLFPLELFSNIPKRITDTEMNFDQLELKKAESRVEEKSWDAWLKVLGAKGCFLLNGKGASLADMIIVAKRGTFVVFIQEMQREAAKEQACKKRKISTLSYNTVKAEHAKCNVSTPHLFVIITDEVFESHESLQENEIVLPSDMHSKAIGPLLALLRKHNHSHQPPVISLKHSE